MWESRRKTPWLERATVRRARDAGPPPVAQHVMGGCERGQGCVMGEGAGHSPLEDGQLCLHRGTPDTHSAEKPVGLTWVVFFFF